MRGVHTHLLGAGQGHSAGGRIQSGKQLVLRHHPCLCKAVEECALASVGVANQGYHRNWCLYAIGRALSDVLLEFSSRPVCCCVHK